MIDKVWFLKGICDTVLPPQEYEAPAIDDGKLEVVAIFGSIQMAMSRIINMHHHRIAQVGRGWVGTRKRLSSVVTTQDMELSQKLTWYKWQGGGMRFSCGKQGAG